jgi:hypothetical protein
MLDSFPSLLVATEFPPNASGGGPAVLRQMLRNWPVDRLFWWSCFPERDARFGQRVAAHRVATIPRGFYPSRKLPRTRSWILEQIWARWATRHLRQTLRAFRPEVVWVVPHNWAVPPLAAALPQAGVRFHTTVQDYVDTLTNTCRFGRPRVARMAALADLLYSKAATRDATSHPMAADLAARTGSHAVQILHAGLEPDEFDFLATKANGTGAELRIAHAGTIIVEQEFAQFVGALSRIRDRLFAPVYIELFGSHSYRSRTWFDPSWMREHGDLAAPALATALRQCTWGFSPMSLIDRDPRYNRFSFPTKFISYLAAGLPVIALGHPESSLMKMAQSYGLGVCLTQGDPDWLAQQLLAALSNRNPLTTFREEMLRCGRTEFDADRTRKVLYDCLRNRPPAS